VEKCGKDDAAVSVLLLVTVANEEMQEKEDFVQLIVTSSPL